MGTAIGAAALARGFHVRIIDVNRQASLRAPQAITGAACKHYGSATGTVETAEDLESITACDTVIESVVEDEGKKVAVLCDLDQRMPPERLLASNTSTIPIGRLARDLATPERLCGMHFFLPVPQRPAVELIFTKCTRPATRSAAISLAVALERDVLLAPDGTGFIVNRMMMPYVAEAMQLLVEGVRAERIEEVATRFGMPMGPLTLLDEIGLDTAFHCGWIFAGAYGERIAVSPVLVALIKAARLGRKTGTGFFRYVSQADGAAQQETDPELAKIVACWSKERDSVTDEEIALRLFLPMVFEGARILDEHAAVLASEVDLGVILGLGMSPARGGPLYWCDRVGTRRMLELAKPLASLGVRMEPPQRIRRMAEQNATFYDVSGEEQNN